MESVLQYRAYQCLVDVCAEAGMCSPHSYVAYLLCSTCSAVVPACSDVGKTPFHVICIPRYLTSMNHFSSALARRKRLASGKGVRTELFEGIDVTRYVGLRLCTHSVVAAGQRRRGRLRERRLLRGRTSRLRYCFLCASVGRPAN